MFLRAYVFSTTFIEYVLNAALHTSQNCNSEKFFLVQLHVKQITVYVNLRNVQFSDARKRVYYANEVQIVA